MILCAIEELPKNIITDFFMLHWGSPEMVISSGVYDCSELDGFAVINEEETEEKDKADGDQHSQTHSSISGYYVLALSAGLILLISEGTINANEINNYPLLLVVCLALVIQPITQFLSNKNYSQKDTYTRA